MADPQDVAKQFVQYYYDTFDTNREGLSSLYRPESILNFESEGTRGAEQITAKLVNLPLGAVKHNVATLDAQPVGNDGSIMVLVTGSILQADQQQSMSYSQVFQLKPNGQGSYFVSNDIFRLVFG